jgi:uncharacterized protein (TIGR02246 family)
VIRDDAEGPGGIARSENRRHDIRATIIPLSCPAQGRSPSVTDQHADIQAVLNGYAAAVYAKDIDAFVALYDDDVHHFDAWNEFESRGVEAIRAAVTGWFGSLGEERVPVELNDVEIASSGDVAFAHAAVTFAGESATGERLRAMTNRFTFGFRRRNGAWKIAHQHSSLPIDMASMTAIFAR